MFTQAKLFKAFEGRGIQLWFTIYHHVQRSDLAAQIVDLILFFYQGSTFVIGKK